MDPSWPGKKIISPNRVPSIMIIAALNCMPRSSKPKSSSTIFRPCGSCHCVKGFSMESWVFCWNFIPTSSQDAQQKQGRITANRAYFEASSESPCLNIYISPVISACDKVVLNLDHDQKSLSCTVANPP